MKFIYKGIGLISILFIVSSCSFSKKQIMNKAGANDSCKIEVVVLDPGHFHASRNVSSIPCNPDEPLAPSSSFLPRNIARKPACTLLYPPPVPATAEAEYKIRKADNINPPGNVRSRSLLSNPGSWRQSPARPPSWVSYLLF